MAYSKYTTAKADRALMRAVLKAEGKPKRRRKSTALVAGVTRSVGNYGRYAPGAELKYFDSMTTYPVNVTAILNVAGGFFQLFSVNSITGATLDTGVGPSQRVGRKITLKHLLIDSQIQINWAAAVDPVPQIDYRCDLILDRQCNGGPYAAPGNIGTDVYDVQAGANPAQSFLNLSNEGRFSILKRWEGSIETDSRSIVGAATTGGITIEKHLKCSKKVNIPVEFLGVGAGSGNLANIKSNNIFLLYTFAGGAGMSVFLTGSNMRTRYTDN